eukprot:Nitzschia sp. Nitz4//scaffold70_size99833//25402//25857//NITZ4_004589-RA/size99833-snap-gene-0.142-mRNA-1//-1//CDS//3329557117//542//frame0
MSFSIPSELQLPLVVVLGLLGFLVVLGLSSLSAQKDSASSSTSTPSTSFAPMSTPTKGGSGAKGVTSPIETKQGSVMTPSGRRSARLAKSRRKEE